MKISKKTSVATVCAILAAALSACGGGGSSGTTDSTSSTNGSSTNSTTASVSTLTGVNGFKVNYTPNFTNATGWTGQVSSPITYTSASSIDSFALADGATPANTYSQSGASGLSAGTFVTIGQTNLGGTTYTYSRFGWLAGSVTETNNSTTTWYTPFVLVSSTPATPPDLSYVGTQQALVYQQADRNGSLSGVSGYAKCDTSASYTASSKTVQLTLSNCSTGVGYTISGGVTLSNGMGTSTLSAQQNITGAAQQTMTSASVDSGKFLLAGPNGEELVGAATIKGTMALSNGTGSSNPGIFLVVFGGKKQ